MAKQNQQIEVKKDAGEIEMPAYAGSIAGVKSAAASNNRPRPRIKVVQGSSKPDVKRIAGEGALLLSPDNTLLAKAGDEFVAVPLYLFETYERHADIDDKSAASVVLESTTDPRSALGRKAQSPNPDDREVPYAGGISKCHHVLNAVLYFDSGENKGGVAVASWKIRGGGSRSGKNFAGLIARREDKGVWCYMNRVAFKSEQVDTGDYAWYTITAANPSDGAAFVAEAHIPALKAMHDDLARLHAADGIAVAAESEDAPAEDIPF